MIHLVEGLARHADVTLACFGSGPALPFEGVRVRTASRGPWGALRANLTCPDPRIPAQVRLYLDHGMRQVVRHELDQS